jgi:ABC-2 type transport system ATP-binding protein
MLDLVRRIGAEFGISILSSSHLLSEIERACDHVVLIDAGRIVRSDSLTTFTGRTGSVVVEVDGPADALAAYLRERGHDLQERGRLLELERVDDTVYDEIRDGAAALELGLVRIEQGRRHLEDLFRDEVEAPVGA